jgi:hypothetical protein
MGKKHSPLPQPFFKGEALKNSNLGGKPFWLSRGRKNSRPQNRRDISLLQRAPWHPQGNACRPETSPGKYKKFSVGTNQVQWTPAYEEILASFWQANFFGPWTRVTSSNFPSSIIFRTLGRGREDSFWLLLCRALFIRVYACPICLFSFPVSSSWPLCQNGPAGP